MRDEGVIKFRREWRDEPLQSSSDLNDLIRERNKLHRKGLIGVYPDGIGFGNVSVRLPESEGFLISGSQTGNIPLADETHFAHVSKCNIEKNELSCDGAVEASSESLTHAMVYALAPLVRSVVHIHHHKLWARFKDDLPTTREDISYGTPEMAFELKRLFEASDLSKRKILIMAGHEDGIMSFGGGVAEATENLLLLYENFSEGRL